MDVNQPRKVWYRKPMIVKQVTLLAQFFPEKMGKVTIAQGEGLMIGLNCFESGQEHAAHTHAGQDKLYVVVEGRAEVHVADASDTLEPGDIAYAASGVVHAIRNPGPGRLIVLAILAPPPQTKLS